MKLNNLVTQTRLAVACGISREYYNRIEKGKQPLNDELKEVIEKQIERFNSQEPLFLLIDYFRVRFPITDVRDRHLLMCQHIGRCFLLNYSTA